MEGFSGFLTLVQAGTRAIDEVRLRRAYDFAAEIYGGKSRLSGDPLMVHPLEVVKTLTGFKPDEDTVIAALLHEAIDCSKISPQELEQRFGRDVAELVFSVEKMGQVRSRTNDTENVRGLFLSIAKDFRAVLIKLADRLHNMETLQFLPLPKQKSIAKETLEVYAPIASRLGIYSIKLRLEDLAFMYLQPYEYQSIADEMRVFGETQHDTIEQIKLSLQSFLEANGVQAKVDGRFKSIYSIYRKLKRKNKTSVHDLFDLFAMRVVLPIVMHGTHESTEHLYATLGMIHSHWTPLANRFKDYVAVPKPNGYQSLHTTVLGLAPKPHNQPVEIQIRSENMHREAELGIAAHWLYTDTDGKSVTMNRDELDAILRKNGENGDRFSTRAAWLKGLERLQEDILTNNESLETIKADLLSDRIFVLTPQGEVKDLPQHATPVDFAYAVHTDIGHRCAMAKVNGNVVPLNHPLKNGDVVEVILKPKPSPSTQWLSFVKTSRAKERIRLWFKSQDRNRLFKEGRDLLNAALQRFGKPLLDDELSILKKYSDERLTLVDRRRLVEEIGMGSQPATNVVRKLFPENSLPRQDAVKKEVKPIPTEQGGRLRILLAGEAGLPTKLAKCCEPKEGKPIAGYITRGNYATVHCADCRMLAAANPARVLDATWASEEPLQKYRVNVLIRAVDRIGLIRDISTVIADLNVNIIDFELRRRDDAFITRRLTLELTNSEEFEALLQRFEQIKGVVEVMKEEPRS